MFDLSIGFESMFFIWMIELAELLAAIAIVSADLLKGNQIWKTGKENSVFFFLLRLTVTPAMT